MSRQERQERQNRHDRQEREERSGSGSSRDRYKDDRSGGGGNRSDSHDRDRRRKRDRWDSKDNKSSRRSRSRENRRRQGEDKRDNSAQADTRVREMSISPPRSSDSEPEFPAPPAPMISKVSMGFKKASAAKPIKMTLAAPAPVAAPAAVLKPKLASVFNDGSDEEPEEMPAEARMRMRNIGRDTPTSAGPNSFGKTKHGFCDSKNIFQRNLKEAMEKVNPNPIPKFSSTTFKYQP